MIIFIIIIVVQYKALNKLKIELFVRIAKYPRNAHLFKNFVIFGKDYNNIKYNDTICTCSSEVTTRSLARPRRGL